MIVIVNNERCTTPDDPCSVALLLEDKGISGKGTAVALNGRIILRKNWETQFLKEGDNVVIITAAYGG